MQASQQKVSRELNISNEKVEDCGDIKSNVCFPVLCSTGTQRKQKINTYPHPHMQKRHEHTNPPTPAPTWGFCRVDARINHHSHKVKCIPQICSVEIWQYHIQFNLVTASLWLWGIFDTENYPFNIR